MIIWLENARIVSIFAVLLAHVADLILSENSIGSEYWWAGNIFNTFSRWCVPALVMISGALLLNTSKEESLSSFYSKRLSRILIPTLFWSIFFLFWSFLRGFISGNPPTYFALMNRLFRGLPYSHLWFLYMISGLYCFTPFLRIILKHAKKKEIELLTISTFIIAAINSIYISSNGSDGPILFINWFLLYIPFFLVGSLIRRDSHPKKSLLWIVFFLSSLLTSVGYYLVSQQENASAHAYFYGYLSVTVVPMSISAMYLLKSWERPILSPYLNKQVSSLSFGIYLIHPVVLEVFAQTGYMNAVHPAISIPSAAIAIFAVSLLITWFFYKTPYLNRVI